MADVAADFFGVDQAAIGDGRQGLQPTTRRQLTKENGRPSFSCSLNTQRSVSNFSSRASRDQPGG
jgi:hypothetical protein